MKIICVITTRDRTELFARALNSVVNQTRKPDVTIVVSDSLPHNKAVEKDRASAVGAKFTENKYTSNYAGSLNTAMHYILESTLFCGCDLSDTYIALLDDDDIWHDTYLERCERRLNGEDFIVGGLIYCNEQGKQYLSIPAEVTLDSFLRGNPHLQGSNTFIKFTTLLRAGLFDENMSSTTDRDIFARVMLLKPTYAVLPEHLVEVDAYNSRARITNGREKKTDGLRKFYYKYNGYMSDEVKRAFFERAEKLFGVAKRDIERIPAALSDTERPIGGQRYDGRLTVGFIATEYELGLRLLRQIVDLKRPKTKVVVLVNFVRDAKPYIDLLAQSGYEYELIDKARIVERIKSGYFDQFVTEDRLRGDVIRDIAVSRTILQRFLYEMTAPDDVVWILDEDMELKALTVKNGRIQESELDIDEAIAAYKSDYDAVVGSYTSDAPLPTLSTVRTALLDLVYGKTAAVGEVSTLSDFDDYYYDLTDNNGVHLETPIRLTNKGCSLDDVFSGKANSRPLFMRSDRIREVKSRGGNTLIFDRELLNIPNWSIQVGDVVGRRSDYFWAWQAKHYGYKIASVPFATLHDRSVQKFDMRREQQKFLADLIGSSFTKAVDSVGITDDAGGFYRAYRGAFIGRLVKFVASYYRVQGLLSVIGDEKYALIFTDDELKYFVSKAEDYLRDEAVVAAYGMLCGNLRMQSAMCGRDGVRGMLEKHFGLTENSLRLLGNGGESIVFTDGRHVYKYFFVGLNNYDSLREMSACFGRCDRFYTLEFFDVDGKKVIRYPYEDSEPYKGGHARELAELIAFAKANGFAYDNYKPSNFIVVDGRLKLVDYGKSFVPHTEELYLRSIERVYQMLRYPFLSEDEFKQLICRSYKNDAEYINYGKDVFEALVERRYKEKLHDAVLLRRLGEYTFDTVLDYGAGKCKIANALADTHKTDVFDIDTDVLRKRAGPKVNIIERASDVPAGGYDLVLNNLVLCCVDNDTAESIVQDLARAVKTDGRVVVSVCDPFFNGVRNTELRTCGISGDYHTSERFDKHTTVGAAVRREYHRPIEFYLNLLERNGLIVEGIVEGDGANVDTLLPIAEHIIFDCRKPKAPIVYEDCSLMIKTNPMEHRSIYRNIRHIVCSLEKGGRFVRRIAVADLTETADRAKRYDSDDADRLRAELERAEINGLLDEIVYVNSEPDKMKSVYSKYFGVESVDGHSSNGQGLYATLVGFDAVPTRYVFQTDSDILYHNGNIDSFTDGLAELKKGAVTVTLGIASRLDKEPTYGKRTEVRSCFLAVDKLQLPIKNTVDGGVVQLPWHRALDAALCPHESVRLASKDVWFVHPENDKKTEANFVSYAERRVAAGQVPTEQYGKVDLHGDRAAWAEKTDSRVVVYMRGRNTPCEKLKRAFDSLKRQTYRDFTIVYVDDASENESAEYAEFTFAYDGYFRNKVVPFFNDRNVGELANFVFVMQNVIANKNAVVINLDNDDFLVNDAAIEKIVKEFDNGAEITCGNCIRYDKPLRRYKITSFDKAWLRGGDNLWLHPKCFRRYLFDRIDVENDLTIDGKFVEVNTDFAFMLPMIDRAKKRVFIDEILYYFEPSADNVSKQGKYNGANAAAVKQKILLKEKERYEKNHSGNR